jgi:hypothetical protein
MKNQIVWDKLSGLDSPNIRRKSDESVVYANRSIEDLALAFPKEFGFIEIKRVVRSR